MCLVACTPTSALNKWVSIFSTRYSSISFLPRKRVASPEVSCERVRDKEFLSRENQLALLSTGISGSISGGFANPGAGLSFGFSSDFSEEDLRRKNFNMI